jgi:hypothetical protein
VEALNFAREIGLLGLDEVGGDRSSQDRDKPDSESITTTPATLPSAAAELISP